MFILPPGHAQSLRTRRQFSPRERWMIGGVVAVVAALTLALVISISTSGHSTGGNCVDVKFAGVVGGEEYYRCGAAARALCASVGIPGGFTGPPGRAVAAECRKVGIPVGPRG